MLHAQLIDPARVSLAKFFAELLVHQVGFERIQHQRFKLYAAHGAFVVARSFVSCGGAANSIIVDDCEAATTNAALGHAREKGLGPVLLPERHFLLIVLALDLLHAIPQSLVNYAQLGHVLPDDRTFWIRA
ncbi:MAG TPA: hypothetical protein PLV46_22685 [Reyranella sp.]|uniref:hypothetical protein n=1 Tax=Reyranella sp. TaxID=1929291 RepID=UPI002B8A7B6B|nr:hypothetical protein [Reyranella sp.]HQS14896.1 hypothetical protein [Reyranella sp.]HQT14283.1 hypothetical protein [Reyranella sp.]